MRVLRLVGVAVLVAVVGLLASGSVASASWVAWHQVRALDKSELTGLSCPSTQLCVAVDGSGEVMVSTSPTLAGGAWQGADVDGVIALSGISCPSSSLCVAVDRAGNVLTSADPSGGGATWQITNLGRGQPLTSVSCASVSLCVAGDTTALVSTDPTGGRSAWVDTGAGGGLYYECEHYGDTSPGCNAPLTAVSCLPAPAQCVTFNDAGGFGVSGDPAGGPGAWMTTDATAGELLGGSCMSHALCVGVCPLGVDAGSDNCQGSGGYVSGSVLTWDPQSPPPIPSYITVSADNLTGVWCATGGPCFTTDGVAPPGLFSSNGPGRGELFVSTDPAAPGGAWTGVYRDPAGITSVACPSIVCLGVDADGNLLAGDRPGSTVQIRAALRALLGAVARKRFHGSRRRPATFGIDMPANGTLKITWLTTNRSHTIVVTARAHVVEGITSPLKLRLSRRGSHLLRAGHPTLVAIAQLIEPNGTVVTERHRFVFRA
jgi:hypothetical protein